MNSAYEQTEQNKSIIWSYSIYGDRFKEYYSPVVANIKLARQSQAKVVISGLKSDEIKIKDYFSDYLDEIQIIVYDDEKYSWSPKILRYLVSNKIKANYYFFKDSDSIVTAKEMNVMQEWMSKSMGVAMIIRDHPLHVAPILAGMFGISDKISDYIFKSAHESFFLEHRKYNNFYSYDQDWLMNDIYPKIVEISHVYSSFLLYSGETASKLPREEKGDGFIGAQVHGHYPKIFKDAQYYSLYGAELLYVPLFVKHSLFFGKVRPTLLVAYVYTWIRKFFYRNTFA